MKVSPSIRKRYAKCQMFDAKAAFSLFAKIQNINRDKGNDLWQELKALTCPVTSGLKLA